MLPLTRLALVALLPVSLVAQDQEAPVPATPAVEATEQVAPATEPTLAAPPAPADADPTPISIPKRAPHPLRAQAAQPSRPVAGDEEKIDIEFPNSDVSAVLLFYSKLSGKKVLTDNTVQGTVNINVKGIPKSEAVKVVETALFINGFTLINSSDDIVTVYGQGKNPRQYVVPMYSDMSQVPEDDQIISFIFKLENADPAEVAALLLQYIPQQIYNGFIALPKTQAILATESANTIRSVARIIGELDRPPAEVVSEFISLERADAKDVLDKLTAIFEKQPTGGAPGGGPINPAPPGEQAPPPGTTPQTVTTLSEDSLIVGKIKLTADVRTNRIHVVTRPINMPFIRKLISEFDSDLPFGEPTTRALRFVSAGDVLDIVVKAITEPGAKADEGGGAAHTPGQATPVSNASSIGGTGAGGASSLGSESLATKEVDTVPEARTVGNTKIIADKRANAIIVLGNREVKDKIFKVLDQIDVRAPQVMLTAVIGELTLNDNEEFGIDYLLHRGKLGTSGTDGSAGSLVGIARGVNGVSSNTSVDLSGLLSAAGLPGGGGLTALIGATHSLDIIVHALESTGRFHVTSRPMVFTSNNKKAVIASGEQIAVPANIQSSFTGAVGSNNGLVSQSNVEYKDVMLKLEVQPLINSEKEVTLDIVQEVNSISGSIPISGNDIPTIASRRIKTTVSVANEATVVLGGLVQETKKDSRSGIPVLSRIPILGSLFGNKSKGLTRTELIVLIRPTVTNGPVEAVKVGERVQEKLNFPPDLDATLDPVGTRAKVNAAPVKVKTQTFRVSPKTNGELRDAK